VNNSNGHRSDGLMKGDHNHEAVAGVTTIWGQDVPYLELTGTANLHELNEPVDQRRKDVQYA
jgi:hypothetical protein